MLSSNVPHDLNSMIFSLYVLGFPILLWQEVYLRVHLHRKDTNKPHPVWEFLPYLLGIIWFSNKLCAFVFAFLFL